MDIRELTYFTAIVEEGTISAAARRLHISQPPLSAQMHLLEEELGTPLFHRGARQITLTDAGRVLYRYAVEILELTHVAKEEVSNMKDGRKGNLRLGLVSSSSCGELYSLVARFHRACPDVQVKVFEGNTYELLDMLHKGTVDVAALRTPFSGYGLDRTVIRHDAMALAWSGDILPVKNGSYQLADLTGKPLILYRRWQVLVEEELAKASVHAGSSCVTDDARTSLQMAEAGLGIALVPEAVLAWGTEIHSGILSNTNLESNLELVKRKEPDAPKTAGLLFATAEELYG